MEEFVGLNYDSCSPSQSPVREKSPAHHDQGRSPPRSRSASPPSRMNTITPRSLTMSDAEFSCLKNREKRSHNRRMRSRNLLQEKHLVDVMQELYTQRIELATLELSNTKVKLIHEYQLASSLDERSRKRNRSRSRSPSRRRSVSPPLSPIQQQQQKPLSRSRSRTPPPQQQEKRQRQASPPRRTQRNMDSYHPIQPQQPFMMMPMQQQQQQQSMSDRPFSNNNNNNSHRNVQQDRNRQNDRKLSNSRNNYNNNNNRNSRYNNNNNNDNRRQEREQLVIPLRATVPTPTPTLPVQDRQTPTGDTSVNFRVESIANYSKGDVVMYDEDEY